MESQQENDRMKRFALKNRYRHLSAWTLLAALAACGGQDGAEAADAAVIDDDPDVAPAVETTGIPAGFAVRLDRDGADVTEFSVMEDGAAHHFQTGPAGIFYEESGMASGDYTVTATFTEIEAPADHREGMGLIIGGTDLQGPGQAYSYFLVRADGNYLIKRRDGSNTSNVTDGWIESSAVAMATGTADITNALTVQVEGDQTHFSINGEEVEVVPTSELLTDGIWGYRINHNLNVRVTDTDYEGM